MMRCGYISSALFFAGLISLAAVPVLANQIDCGTLTSAVPGPTGIDEVLGAQFQWNAPAETVVPGTMAITSSFGNMGAFNFSGETAVPGGNPEFIFTDANHDIMTFTPIDAPFPTSFSGSYSDALHLSIGCGSAGDTCATDGFGGFYLAQGEINITPTPEPGTLAELSLALGGTGFFMWFQRRRKRALPEKD